MKKRFKQRHLTASRLYATAPPQDKPVRAVVNIGNRFVPKDDAAYATLLVLDKPERRRIRKLQMRGRIDQRLAQVRRADMKAARLASNSHERQRFVAMDRIERETERRRA